jgi:hypothetical protein
VLGLSLFASPCLTAIQSHFPLLTDSFLYLVTDECSDQLEAFKVNQILWSRIHEKIANQIFDAGAVFGFCHDEGTNSTHIQGKVII